MDLQQLDEINEIERNLRARRWVSDDGVGLVGARLLQLSADLNLDLTLFYFTLEQSGYSTLLDWNELEVS